MSSKKFVCFVKSNLLVSYIFLGFDELTESGGPPLDPTIQHGWTNVNIPRKKQIFELYRTRNMASGLGLFQASIVVLQIKTVFENLSS